MPKTFHIDCKGRDGTTSVAQGELGDGEVEVLSDFLGHVERLRQTRLIQDDFVAKLHVATRHGEPLEVDAGFPDRPRYAEFAYELRTFVLANEAYYLPKILGILGRASSDACFRQLLRAASDKFSCRTIKQSVSVLVGDRDITSEAFLRLWMNGFEYHHDPDKRKEIERLHEGLPLDLTKSIMLMLLIDKANTVIYLGRVVELCLRDDSGLRSAADLADGT